jgi:hypothetical protein
MEMPKSYLIPFWVGLMDGDGSIQVNHWRKQCLQYRVVIKLRNHEENVQMLHQIKGVLGGSVSIHKDFVIWVENTPAKVQHLLQLLEIHPPLTTRLNCQIEFALLCLEKNDVTWYLENRKDKYKSRPKYTDLCKARAVILLSSSSNTSCEGQPTEGAAWFSGFLEAEGCFSVHKKQENILKNPVGEGKKAAVKLRGRFLLGHKFDFYLLQSILSFLSCTDQRPLLRKNENDFYVIEIYRKEALDRLQNHFRTAPLLGAKVIQYRRFLNILAQESPNFTPLTS